MEINKEIDDKEVDLNTEWLKQSTKLVGESLLALGIATVLLFLNPYLLMILWNMLLASVSGVTLTYGASLVAWFIVDWLFISGREVSKRMGLWADSIKVRGVELIEDNRIIEEGNNQ